MQFFLAQTETPTAPAATPAEGTPVEATPGAATPGTSAPGTPGGKAPAPKAADTASFMGPLLIIMVVFYFFIFKSKKKQDRKRSEMLTQLKRGDRIQTIGGILGTVVEARDTEVVVKVDESNNIKIRFARSAIHRVIEEDKEKVESK